MVNNKSYLKQTLKELTKLMVGGLTFVSALAWNEAFKDYFSKNEYLEGKGLLFYAIVVSVLAVTIIIFINYIAKQIEKALLLSVSLGLLLFMYVYFIHDLFFKKRDMKKDTSSKHTKNVAETSHDEIIPAISIV